MKKLSCFLVIGLDELKAECRFEHQWSMQGIGLDRINWLDKDKVDDINRLIKVCNKENISPIIIMDSTSSDILLGIDGYYDVYYETLNPLWDGIKIQLQLSGARDISDSFFSVFKSSYEAIQWDLYINSLPSILDFSANYIKNKVANFNEDDRQYFSEISNSLDPNEFVLQQDGETFHHPAVPFFKIMPNEEVCELPLPDDGMVQKELLSALKARLNEYDIAQPTEESPPWGGLARVFRFGKKHFNTLVNYNNILDLGDHVIDSGGAYADDNSEDPLSGIFPINVQSVGEWKKLELLAYSVGEMDLARFQLVSNLNGQAIASEFVTSEAISNGEIVKIIVKVKLPPETAFEDLSLQCSLDLSEVTLTLSFSTGGIKG